MPLWKTLQKIKVKPPATKPKESQSTHNKNLFVEKLTGQIAKDAISNSNLWGKGPPIAAAGLAENKVKAETKEQFASQYLAEPVLKESHEMLHNKLQKESLVSVKIGTVKHLTPFSCLNLRPPNHTILRLLNPNRQSSRIIQAIIYLVPQPQVLR